MDDLTWYLQDEVPWCILFADDIVLIDETRSGINTNLELWRDALESKCFKIRQTKTNYIECNFGNDRIRDEETVKIINQEISKKAHFQYLGSIIEGNEELKRKFFRTTVTPTLLHGTECWAVEKQHAHRMSVAEIRLLRWISGKTRRDRIRNEYIRENLGVAPIGDKMKKNRLKWAGHVQHRSSTTHVRRCELVQVEG
ncbi:hypothetical protein AMTRI_Chr05g67600 [Amborella trichopoda]